MRNILFLLIASLTVSSAIAEEPYRIGIDGKPKYLSQEKTFRLLPEPVKPVIKPHNMINPFYRKTYVWVEDIYQNGLWYYGYYSPTGDEFRYYRREYKGALSNFRSLYSVYYKYELRTKPVRSVRVVYEPAY